MKKIKSVVIDPGCVSCGSCQIACPDVFDIQGTAQVKANASIDKHVDEIHQAASLCPVGVIQIQEHEG